MTGRTARTETEPKLTALEQNPFGCEIMRTALLLVGFNRLDYFDQTLTSLEANKKAHDFDLHVYIDGGPNALQDDIEERVKQTTFERVTVVRRSENWGIGRHLIDARRHLFDTLHYDCVMLFEDDMILASHYVETLSNMLSWSAEYNDIGTVMAYNINPDPMDQQANQLSEIVATNRHFWGYGMTRKVWNDIKPILYEFEERYLRGVAYAHRSHRFIRWFFMRKWMKKPRRARTGLPLIPSPLLTPPFDQKPRRCPTSQDAITALALWHHGYARITTRVSRARYVGETGFSFSPEVFEKMGFNDQNTPDFASIGSAPTVFRLAQEDLDGRLLKPPKYE